MGTSERLSGRQLRHALIFYNRANEKRLRTLDKSFQPFCLEMKFCKIQ